MTPLPLPPPSTRRARGTAQRAAPHALHRVPPPRTGARHPFVLQVIQYSKHHHRAEQCTDTTRTETEESWDARFLDDVCKDGLLFNLFKAADYLNIKPLLDLTCFKIAGEIKILRDVNTFLQKVGQGEAKSMTLKSLREQTSIDYTAKGINKHDCKVIAHLVLSGSSQSPSMGAHLLDMVPDALHDAVGLLRDDDRGALALVHEGLHAAVLNKLTWASEFFLRRVWRDAHFVN